MRTQNKEKRRYLGNLVEEDSMHYKRETRSKKHSTEISNFFHVVRKTCLELKKRLEICLSLSITLYRAQIWTLKTENQRMLKAFEIEIWRRMEKIRWADRLRNEEVLAEWNREEDIRKRTKVYMTLGEKTVLADSVLKTIVGG